MSSDIPELSLLEDIEELSSAYLRTFGATPVNISTWNPSRRILAQLSPLPPQHMPSWIDYTFSYDLIERPSLLSHHGYSTSKFGCLVVHSGSAAIVSVANWLRVRGVKRVLLLAPRYFSVPHALEAVGISHGLLHLRRSAAGFCIPAVTKDALRGYDAVWITNPVYCTSVDLPQTGLAQLASIARDCGIVCVADECLAEPGRYLGPMLSDICTTVAIYAPHKAVCVNGLKFAVSIFPRSEQQHFDSWSDVWSGCVPASSVLALRHFLSPDFQRYRAAFKARITATQSTMRQLLSGLRGVETDDLADGYLVSVYVPKLSANFGRDIGFLREAIWQSGASFIPGIRNELDPESGLSFRVNLAALDATACGGLLRLCTWLTTSDHPA